MNLKSRLKELAAKSEEKRSGVGRAALIGGGVLAGGLVGMRTLPRLLPRGRLVQEGESLLGKVQAMRVGAMAGAVAGGGGAAWLTRRKESQ